MSYKYFSVAIHTRDLEHHMWEKSHFAEVRSCMILALNYLINKPRVVVFCRVKGVLHATWERFLKEVL